MSISALISGSVVKAPESKVSAGGKEYVVVVVKSGEDFIRCLLFGDDLRPYMKLQKGEDKRTVMRNLEAMGWIREVIPSRPESRVRAPSHCWEVNPRVHVRFASLGKRMAEALAVSASFMSKSSEG